MARHTPNRVVRAVTDAMWKRDQREMRAIDALLSVAAPRKRTRRRRKTTPRRRTKA